MDGSMRTGFPVNMSFSAKASKNRWMSHSFIGWCCPQFPSSFLLKRTLIAWLCGRVSQSLSWVLLDPSAQLEITLPDTSNSAFSSHKYFHFHSGPLNNIRQKWEYRRWELPPGGRWHCLRGRRPSPKLSVSREVKFLGQIVSIYLCVVTLCSGVHIVHIRIFHKNNFFLEIHIAEKWFLFLGPIETDVRKCISPKYVSFFFN